MGNDLINDIDFIIMNRAVFFGSVFIFSSFIFNFHSIFLYFCAKGKKHKILCFLLDLAQNKIYYIRGRDFHADIYRPCAKKQTFLPKTTKYCGFLY